MSKFSTLRQSAFFTVGITTLLLLTFVLIALFFYLTFNQVEAANTANTITSTLTAQSVMDKVDRNFYERFGDVQAFAVNRLAVASAEQDSLVPGAQEFINTMTAYYVLYDLMMICNSSGTVLAVNTKDKNGGSISSQHFLGRNMAGEAWFKVCTSAEGPKGGAWFSDFIVRKDVGQIYGTDGHGMAFAAPIRNTAGNVVGVWYNFASWKEVTEGIREQAEHNLQKDHPSAFVIMMKKTGEIISTAKPDLMAVTLSVDTSNHISTDNDLIPLEDLTYGVSRSKGAYTFAGKEWITAAFIPKEKISWAVFFSRKNLIAVTVCLLVVSFLAGFVFRFFTKNIIARINTIKDLQQRLSEGEIVQIQENGHLNDEFGQMSQSLGKLAKSLQHKASFADEISKGDLNTVLNHVHKNDTLGNSLVNMRNQLQLAKEKDAQRNWSAEGLAQIAVIMRSYESVEKLYTNIIRFVVTYLGASQGGLFLVSGTDEDQKITLEACYAFNKKKFLEKTLNFGEGLIGQCIIEKQTQYITRVPENYTHITSGLGEALPRALLIVPLHTNDVVLGAIEIASFNQFKPHHIEFVEKLAESISASLNTIRGSENTTQLVTQLQQQTEEMKAQEEEMRQNMEELSATQEEMLRKEREYLSRISELEKR